MMKSPQSGQEFEDAIKKSLSPGETLISFANCWQQSEDTSLMGTNVRMQGLFDWRYIALTNIKVRLGKWATSDEGKDTVMGNLLNPPSHGIKGPTPIPECTSSQTVLALDDVASTTIENIDMASYLKSFRPKISAMQRVPPATVITVLLLNGSRTGLNKQKDIRSLGYKNAKRVPLSRTIFTAGNIGLELFSFFGEMETVVKNLEEVKSGSLLASKASEAANALDALVPLLHEGVITQEEFDRAKDGFLGSTIEVQESSVGQLRQLHSLCRDGVLTESEFNMKKWDILSKG